MLSVLKTGEELQTRRHCPLGSLLSIHLILKQGVWVASDCSLKDIDSLTLPLINLKACARTVFSMHGSTGCSVLILAKPQFVLQMERSFTIYPHEGLNVSLTGRGGTHGFFGELTILEPLKNKRDEPLGLSLTSQGRLMVVYFRNVIHSVSAYQRVCAMWLCISFNSLGPISDGACRRLIRRFIQDGWAFCPSNAKHLTQSRNSTAMSGRGQATDDNKMRQTRSKRDAGVLRQTSREY